VCAVERSSIPVGASPTRPSLIAPAGSYRSGGGGKLLSNNNLNVFAMYGTINALPLLYE
jgi:hypothetical protein